MYYGEKLNSISHLVGSIFSLVALGALLALSIPTGDPRIIVGYSVFGLTLVLLYAMSTLYHSFQAPRLKKVFKVLDHISIYLLIAGTYTPLMLISVDNSNGNMILAAGLGSCSDRHPVGNPAIRTGSENLPTAHLSGHGLGMYT